MSNDFKKQIYISTAGIHDGIFDQLIQEHQRGLRAKMPSLYNDVMTEDGLVLMTNEEIETVVAKFNSIGCTSFTLTSEQIEQLLTQHEQE